MSVYIVGGGLSGSCACSWGCSRSALLHLVFNQKELEHRVEVLIDGLFYSFLQQVALCFNLCVFLPCHCIHGGLQKSQTHQHGALLGREKGGAS